MPDEGLGYTESDAEFPNTVASMRPTESHESVNGSDIHTATDSNTLVEGGFDESVLRALCEMDVSGVILPLFAQLSVCCTALNGPNKAEHGLMQGMFLIMYRNMSTTRPGSFGFLQEASCNRRRVRKEHAETCPEHCRRICHE